MLGTRRPSTSGVPNATHGLVTTCLKRRLRPRTALMGFETQAADASFFLRRVEARLGDLVRHEIANRQEVNSDPSTSASARSRAHHTKELTFVRNRA